MFSIALERRGVTAHSSDGGENRIEQRQSNDKEWEKESRSCRRARAIVVQRQKRDNKTKRSGPTIVRNYLFRIFDKLGVSTRVELVLYCFQEQQTRSSADPRDVHAARDGSNGASPA